VLDTLTKTVKIELNFEKNERFIGKKGVKKVPTTGLLNMLLRGGGNSKMGLFLHFFLKKSKNFNLKWV